VGENATRIWSRIQTLTAQQRVVLRLLVSGKLNKQIAFELNVSMTTVKAHVSAVLTKLGVKNRTQAVILVNKVNFAA
jgi:DNA-binding NarL/FixJ family response regulator